MRGYELACIITVFKPCKCTNLLKCVISLTVCHEHQFKDKYLFYRFCEDDQGVGMIPSPAEKRACEDELPDVLNLLEQIGPDAMMRMILRKL